MSTRNFPGGKGRPARKDDLTAICEPIVENTWEPRRLTTLSASTACYRDSFTFIYNKVEAYHVFHIRSFGILTDLIRNLMFSGRWIWKVMCSGMLRHAVCFTGVSEERSIIIIRRMPSSGMWSRVDILLTDVSEEHIAYIFTLVHLSWNSYTVKMEAIRSSETSVNKISTCTRRHIPEGGILLKRYQSFGGKCCFSFQFRV
jgi:hypothetical protein